MALRVYNTLTRRKEAFKPLAPPRVRMFVCGPTVYDHAHLGHARSYLSFDVIARWLRYRGYELTYVQNITDIDDKIIARANEQGRDAQKVAREYEQSYLEDMAALGIRSVDRHLRAMDHVPEILDQVKRLVDKGCAYPLEDGVYFDVSRFEEYGKLSRQPLEELVQSRVEPNPDKRNPGDFVLWKASKPREPAWKSPWMPGRPGWHIEDTAITEKHLGAQYDLHGGGQDLIFPHHEAEIAQMESLSGKPLCRYWLHNGFVTINGEKMSKSLGNFTTAKDLLVRYDPEAIRLFVVSSHYHDPIDYTLQRLEAARNTLQRLRDCLANLDDALPKARPGAAPGEAVKMVEDLTRQFEKGMDDDFNTPEALKALHALRDYANEYLASKGRTRGGLELIRGRYLKLANALGLLERAAPGLPSGVTEEWVLAKIEEREKARKKKDFKGADAVREELRRKGILVDDTAEGPRWKVAVLPSPARGAR